MSSIDGFWFLDEKIEDEPDIPSGISVDEKIARQWFNPKKSKMPKNVEPETVSVPVEIPKREPRKFDL